MESLPEYMKEYREQLEKGYIQKAYRGLMEYILGLKTHFKNNYPDYFVSGSIYQGYMDMTYFAVCPESFKRHNLKAAVVFNFEKFAFEVWLAGNNKRVQRKYWQLFKESGWHKYHVVANIKGVDSIIEHTLADRPDFSNLDGLTGQIEQGVMEFIEDIDSFLSEH